MNICIKEENFAFMILFLLFWIFIINKKEAIYVKVPIEQMKNVSVFDFTY